jgi:hypothetical protein
MFQSQNQMPEEEEPPPQLQAQPSYYMPPQFEKHDEFLEGISKQTLILAFAAFFLGLLIGKSMTPVVLRQ